MMQDEELLTLIVQKPQPQAALRRLKEITNKKISFECILPGKSPCLNPEKNKFTICFDPDSRTAEQSLVHEITHAILFEEGYPFIESKYPDFSNYATNAVQHPEVFRRMEKIYFQNMEAYFELHWSKIIDDYIKSLVDKNRRKHRSLPFLLFDDFDVFLGILDQFVWHYIGHHSQLALKTFAEEFPEAYDLSVRLYQIAQSIGLDNPEKARRAAKSLTDCVYQHYLNSCPSHPNTSYWHEPRILTLSEKLTLLPGS